MPHVYRDVDAPEGTVIELNISGDCGGGWFLSKGPAAWNFLRQPVEDVAARITISQALAWRLFTKGIDRDAARSQIELEGNLDLGQKILDLTAIVG
jgi:hypothetical protein